MTRPVVLDTDTVSMILTPAKKQNPIVALRAIDYLSAFGRFSFSAITRFEVRRGYIVTRSISAFNRFEWFCQSAEILPITDSVLTVAADLWAYATQNGHPRGDATC
jgi:tRNA(fMet)-specific endonuclease VapC